MTPDAKLKLRDMFLEIQKFGKEEQKLKAAELLDYWVEASSEKHVRLILPYVAGLLRPGRSPSDAIPTKALERAEYFEKLIHQSKRDSSDFRNQLLEKTREHFSITKEALVRDLKTAKDYYASLGSDVTGFTRTSRKSD